MSTTFAPRAGENPLTVFRDCFGAPRALIGMLHLGALPGTPSASDSLEKLIERAVTEDSKHVDSDTEAKE